MIFLVILPKFFIVIRLIHKVRDLVQGQSYQVKTVLEQYNTRNKTFLAFKDSPGNPLSRLPYFTLCAFGEAAFTLMYIYR